MIDLAMEKTITHALKEWAVAVDALEKGNTIMLLRKGGIREQGGRFTVAHHQVLLYPTYEHQKPELLKPEYADQVTPVESGWHPATIRIGAWAEITDILETRDETVVTQLLAYHIWNEQMVSDRLKWKPREPLYILLLRTYLLTPAQQISYRQEYGGCKSWIDLAEPIKTQKSEPILSDKNYQQIVYKIRQIIMK